MPTTIRIVEKEALGVYFLCSIIVFMVFFSISTLRDKTKSPGFPRGFQILFLKKSYYLLILFFKATPATVANAPIDPIAFISMSTAVPVPAKSVVAPSTSPVGAAVQLGQLEPPSLRPSDLPSPGPPGLPGSCGTGVGVTVGVTHGSSSIA